METGAFAMIEASREGNVHVTGKAASIDCNRNEAEDMNVSVNPIILVVKQRKWTIPKGLDMRSDARGLIL